MLDDAQTNISLSENHAKEREADSSEAFDLEESLAQLGEDVAGHRRKLSTYMRDTESLTEEMKEDVIQLLRVFSLPYIVAPFEAEAQCAVLEEVRSPS